MYEVGLSDSFSTSKKVYLGLIYFALSFKPGDLQEIKGIKGMIIWQRQSYDSMQLHKMFGVIQYTMRMKNVVISLGKE